MHLGNCLVRGLSRITESQRGNRSQAPWKHPVCLCVVWYLRKGPREMSGSSVTDWHTVQVSAAPGDSAAQSGYSTPMPNSRAAPVVPGKHLTPASNSQKLLLKNHWEVKALLCYLKIYIISLFMRGLKNVHFLEGAKDGNKYMAGWDK